MCSYFRSVSQPKCGSVDELVDRFWRKVGLKVTHKNYKVKKYGSPQSAPTPSPQCYMERVLPIIAKSKHRNPVCMLFH